MAHVAKYTKAQVGAMSRHYERAQKDDGEYQSFGNQDIDVSKIHLNYNLAPERDGQGQLDFIKQRTSEVKCHNRADVKVMCSWVVTAPKDLKEHEHGRFFEEVYKFLNNRYFNGSDRNVVSAYVHMDETTPHIHYAFVPVVWDKKKEIEKVSAKELVHRRDLQSFHPDLERYMAEVFGREIGILNEATKDGNKTINELKIETARKELHEEMAVIEAEKEQTLIDLSNARSDAIRFLDEASHLENKRDSLYDELGGIEGQIKTEEEKLEGLRKKTKAEEDKNNKIKIQTSQMQGQIKSIHQNTAHATAVNAEYEAKKKYLNEAKKSSDISMMYPDYAKVSKKTFGKDEFVTVPKDKWEEKHVSANEVNYIKEMQKSLEKSMYNFIKSQSGMVWHGMKEKIIALEKEVEKLSAWSTRDKTTIKDLGKQLVAKDKEHEGLIARVNRVLGKIADGAAQDFVREWKAEEENLQRQQQKRRGWDGPEL